MILAFVTQFKRLCNLNVHLRARFRACICAFRLHNRNCANKRLVAPSSAVPRRAQARLHPISRSEIRGRAKGPCGPWRDPLLSAKLSECALYAFILTVCISR